MNLKPAKDLESVQTWRIVFIAFGFVMWFIGFVMALLICVAIYG